MKSWNGYRSIRRSRRCIAVLAAFCVLEVGRGPPLSFIYFRF